MRQGLLPYTVAVVPARDTLTARAGLPLVVELMRALGLDQAIAEHVRVRARASGYPETAKVEALVLLLAAGGDCVDDIAVLKADAGLGRLLGRTLPSAAALWAFLQACHDDARLAEAQAARGPARVAYIPAESAPLRGLAAVNTACVRGVAARGGRARWRPWTTTPRAWRATSARPCRTLRGAGATSRPPCTGSNRTSWWPTSIATATCPRGWTTSR